MRTAKTDQTGRLPRLIWVFAGRRVILLVLSWGGSVFTCYCEWKKYLPLYRILVWYKHCQILSEPWPKPQREHFTSFHWSAIIWNTAWQNQQNEKTQISLGTCPDWSESSLCALRVAKGPTYLHVDSKDSDQTGWMPRLIWVFAWHICHFVGFCCTAA